MGHLLQNLSYENEFDLHWNGLMSKTDFRMKGFALGLVLIQMLRELGNGLFLIIYLTEFVAFFFNIEC